MINYNKISTPNPEAEAQFLAQLRAGRADQEAYRHSRAEANRIAARELIENADSYRNDCQMNYLCDDVYADSAKVLV